MLGNDQSRAMRSGSINEQLHRFAILRADPCAGTQAQWWNREDALATDSQVLSAGSKYPCALCMAKQVTGQPRACIDQMLAVIEDQQHPPMFKVVEDGFGNGFTNVFSQAQYASYSVCHEVRV